LIARSLVSRPVSSFVPRLAAWGLACLAFLPQPALATSDTTAVRIADQVMTTLGGHTKWDALEGLRWSFEVSINDTVRASRRHAWDKHTGWHRVEGTNRAGQKYVIIHKLGDKAGLAWVGGTKIEGDSLTKLVTLGQSLWTNDSYWFLMPYKLRDPGVNLTYVGQGEVDGKSVDKLALSFDHVGETPGDHYWVSVDRATHRVVKWEYVLEGQQPPPTPWMWTDWEEHDGLWFSTARRGDNKRTIYTRNLEMVSHFPSETFTAP